MFFYTMSTVLDVAVHQLQADANAVPDWFTKGGLCINTDKTKIVLFGKQPSTNALNIKIKMGPTILEQCRQYEYLGIILDSNFTLEKSISKTVSSASIRNVMLTKMRRKISTPTALSVYKQTILPVLEYCGYLFNGVIQTQHKRLQLLQNRCLRTSLNVRIKYHVRDLHIDAGIHQLSIRYDLQLMLLLYKYLYGSSHAHEELGLVFQTGPACGRVTRSTNTGLLVYPDSKKIGFRKSPLYRGIDLWNSLNTSCRQANTKNIFRAKALQFIVAAYAKKHPS